MMNILLFYRYLKKIIYLCNAIMTFKYAIL